MGKPVKLSSGDKAPAFELPAVTSTTRNPEAAKNVTLDDSAGRWLVLYFYPKDNTPGCTREAQAFTKLLATFKKAKADVIGVSKDTVASHCGFRDKLKLGITLASDPDLTVHKAYGAYGEKTMYGKKVQGVIRSTFLIDPKGRVKRAWSNVKVDGHADAVLEELKNA
jgi:peroxiredoxin Q/BCP